MNTEKASQDLPFRVSDRLALIEAVTQMPKIIDRAKTNEDCRVITAILVAREYSRTNDSSYGAGLTWYFSKGKLIGKLAGTKTESIDVSPGSTLAYSFARFAWDPNTGELGDLQDDHPGWDSKLDPGLVLKL